MDKRVVKTASTARQISHGLILLCCLLPLSFVPGLLSLYRLPKTALLAFLTAVLCWLWAPANLRPRQSRVPAPALFMPLSSYLLLSAFSLFFAINPYEGFTVLLQSLSGIALFWITSSYFETHRLSQFFHWSAIAAGIVSAIGIAQAWGADIPTLVSVSVPGSTFGNRNMAAQYLLFVLPAAFYLLLSSTEARREWSYAALAGLMSTYFVYTGTRAAWGGAAVGLMLVFACLLAAGKTKESIQGLKGRKSGFLLGIAVFVVIMNTLPPFLFPGFQAQRPLTRLESMMDVETEGYSRFAIWANSLAIFADHPILGVGKGNFRFIYPVYARRVIEDPSFTPQQKATDVHNDYIQLLAETGLLGAASFLLIPALLALRIWRSRAQTVEPALMVSIFGLAGILAEAFWDFPFNLPVPIAFFWVYAGVLWRLTGANAPAATQKVPRALVLSIVVLVACFAAIFSVLTFSSLRGEYYYSRGADQMSQGRLNEAERDLRRATQISPLNYRYQFLLGLLLIRIKEFEKSADATLRSLSLNPYNINALNNLGVAYASSRKDAQAIQAFQTALRIWPRHIEAHKNLGVLYAREGEKEKATGHFRAALALDPADRQARESLAALGVGPLPPEMIE